MLELIWFIKELATVGVSKWTDVLWRVALTNGLLKMRDRLIFSIVLLPKKIMRLFLGDDFIYWRGWLNCFGINNV